MKNHALILTAALLLPLAPISSPASAVSHPYEFHADARMRYENLGPIENAYGYLNIVTDQSGNGVINVMFSNASRLNVAMFNARVKFISASGTVIREEKFDCWIDAAGYREATECKVTKPLGLGGFESVEVDFYLSDVPQINAAAVIY